MGLQQVNLKRDAHVSSCRFNSLGFSRCLLSESYMQLQMFSLEDPVLIKIRDVLNNLDVNTLTPVEALMKLDEIQKVLKKS